MYIKFNRIDIDGFNSIDKIGLNLLNQGTVLVKGINNYEQYSLSNGSGKSSLFEAICWSLFGKTSKGLSKVSNRVLNRGCSVYIEFSIDTDIYSIRRSIDHCDYGSSIEVIQNGNNISGRNKTDTDKIIQNSILKEFTYDTFLSIIFLSQGFGSRFGALSPSGRKDRIESLSNISDSVDEFRDKLSNSRSEYESEVLVHESNRSKLYGKESAINEEINRLNTLIIQSSDITSDVEPLELLINELKEKYDLLCTKLLNIRDKLSELNNKKSVLGNSLSSLTSRKQEIEKLLKPINSGVCPTCNQKLSKNLNDSIKESYISELNMINSKIDKLTAEISSIKSNIESMSSSETLIKNEVDKISSDRMKASLELSRISNSSNISEYRSRLNELHKELSVITDSIQSESKLVDKFSDLKGATVHSLSLITKQFRGYLLDDIVKFINSRLEYYSGILYSNDSDIVSIKTDSSKLDIYLGDKLYDSLSGGESRKVDIAMSMAQRDLSFNISGSSSNIFIVDEIFDSLDEKAITSVMSLFVDSSDEIDSMYIISHKHLSEIQYDSTITVAKGDDEISKIV